MQMELSRERLDLYRVYLEVAGLCGDIVSRAEHSIAVFDHLDRAMESIGVNFMRANVQTPGSAQRASCLDVSIASTHECAASLDVCLARRAVEEGSYSAGMGQLWRIRGMLLGMKRAGVNQVREEPASYGGSRFPFMALDLYRVSLESIRWIHELLNDLAPRVRARRKLDESTTGTILNLAEGHWRESVADQNRFMRTAQEYAFQTILSLDLMVARGEMATARVVEGKAMQARIISMLHAWCASNEKRNEHERGIG